MAVPEKRLKTDRAVSDLELLELVIAALRERDWPNPQLGRHGLQPSAYDFGSVYDVASGELGEFIKHNGSMPEFELRLAEILAELMLSGLVLLTPLNPGAYALTAKGRATLSGEGVATFAPSSYIDQLRAGVPSLDETTLQYIDEGIRALNSGLLRSSAIMLGVAAERLILGLASTLATTLHDIGIKAPKGLTDWQVSKVRAAIRSAYDQNRSAIQTTLRSKNIDNLLDVEAELHSRMDDILASLHSAYKFMRDEQGHGSESSVNESRLRLSFQTFPDFVQYIDKLERLLQFCWDL